MKNPSRLKVKLHVKVRCNPQIITMRKLLTIWKAAAPGCEGELPDFCSCGGRF